MPARQCPVPKAERLFWLRRWLQTRWYGATKESICSRWPDFYGDATPHSADERRFYRDMGELVGSGEFLRLENYRGAVERVLQKDVLWIRRDRAHVAPEAEL